MESDQATNPKKLFKKFGLISAMIFYTGFGALIFQHLEHDYDVRHIQNVTEELINQRNSYLSEASKLYLQNFTEHLNESLSAQFAHEILLNKYENILEKSIDDGISFHTLHEFSLTPRWSFIQCIFFSATVLTTIGYGHIAPATKAGKIFCIIYALIGIPLTRTVIADMGDGIVTLLPSNALENSLLKKVMKSKWNTLFSIIGTLGLLLLFIAIGGILFLLLEDWSFLDSFYFCFITTTTIGFGDIVPKTDSLLICGAYIMVGLALTSTAIELFRRQYAESFDKMKMLTLRLQELSTPLAEAMKKMAEAGAGEINVDANLVKELQEINSALSTVGQVSNAGKEDPWKDLLKIAENKKKITIYFYETSL